MQFLQNQGFIVSITSDNDIQVCVFLLIFHYWSLKTCFRYLVIWNHNSASYYSLKCTHHNPHCYKVNPLHSHTWSVRSIIFLLNNCSIIHLSFIDLINYQTSSFISSKATFVLKQYLSKVSAQLRSPSCYCCIAVLTRILTLLKIIVQVWSLERRSIACSLQWDSIVTAFSVINGSSFMYE